MNPDLSFAPLHSFNSQFFRSSRSLIDLFIKCIGVFYALLCVSPFIQFNLNLIHQPCYFHRVDNNYNGKQNNCIGRFFCAGELVLVYCPGGQLIPVNNGEEFRKWETNVCD